MTVPAQPPPEAVLNYAERLAAAVAIACGGRLHAAFLHGSAALGGWVTGRSDVDMLLVTTRRLPDTIAGDLARTLVASAGACPGRELEASVVTRAQACAAAEPWPFLLHVTAGPGRPARVVCPDRRSGGDPDLLMHYAVCREAGWRLYGMPPRDVIGLVPRPVILAYLAGEMLWGAGHAPEAYCVLNACRALEYLASGRIVSKIAGGEAALAAVSAPAGIVRRALRQQRGTEPDRPLGADAADFVLAAAGALRAAAAPDAGA